MDKQSYNEMMGQVFPSAALVEKTKLKMKQRGLSTAKVTGFSAKKLKRTANVTYGNEGKPSTFAKKANIIAVAAVFAVVAVGMFAILMASGNWFISPSDVGLSDMPPDTESIPEPPANAESDTCDIAEPTPATTPDTQEMQEIPLERAKEIIFKLLLDIQEEIRNAGTLLPSEESSYALTGELEDRVKKYEYWPDFEMMLASIDDIDFIEIYLNPYFKESDTAGVYDVRGNSWRAYARVNTTWGVFNGILNFVWIISIDSITGELDDVVLAAPDYDDRYGNFFPGIDDTLLPDDTVKMSVGTLADAWYVDYSDGKTNQWGTIPGIVAEGGYDSLIYLEFASVTTDEFTMLRNHYKSGAVEIIEERENFLHCAYNWGEIHMGSVLSDPSFIGVHIAYWGN